MLHHARTMILTAALALAAAPAAAQAQLRARPAPQANGPADTARPVQPTGPAAGGPVLRASAVTAQPARRAAALGAGGSPLVATSRTQSRAMMVVGGVALVVGAVIGNTAGTLVMVGGAVVGLVGLYDYLQ